MADRFDVSTTTKWRKDENDNLIVDCTPTRAGIFLYHDGKGGVIRELRHPDDVFNADSLGTLDNVPYTTQENHLSLFTPKDTTGKAYGITLGGSKRVGNNASNKLKIWDEQEIKKIFGGKSLEVSCGYRCDYYKNDDGTLLSGTWEGQEFDTRQKNIKYNHVARVKKARGGESCRICLDSESAISGIGAERLDSGILSNNQLEKHMDDKKTVTIIQRQLPPRESGGFRLDALDIKIGEDQQGIVDTFTDRETKLFNELVKVNSEFTKQTVKMDSLKTENKTLTDNSKGLVSDERLDQEVKNAIALYKLADQCGIKEYEKMDSAELKKSIVKASGMFNAEKLDSEDYVKFAIEHLQDDHANKILKSRQNLKSFEKTDMYEGDDAPSELEKA